MLLSLRRIIIQKRNCLSAECLNENSLNFVQREMGKNVAISKSCLIEVS